MVSEFRRSELKREDPANRILCGMTRNQFDAIFPGVDRTRAEWRATYLPGDHGVDVRYETVNWRGYNKLELLAGQHRKEALRKMIAETNGRTMETDFWWVVNVYDLNMLASIRIDLTGNIAQLLKKQLTGEVFRDMCAVAPELAATDTTVFQPRFHRQPTVDEFLRSSAWGDKRRSTRPSRED